MLTDHGRPSAQVSKKYYRALKVHVEKIQYTVTKIAAQVNIDKLHKNYTSSLEDDYLSGANCVSDGHNGMKIPPVV